MRQFAIIGLGRFGSSVAKTLSEKGYQVLAIDQDKEKVESIASLVTQAIQADATDEKVLRKIGIKDVDVAIIAIGKSLEASILVTLILKEMNVKEIVAKAITEIQGRVLRRVGATKVVFPERDMGIQVANSLISSQIIEYINLSSEHSVVEIVAPSTFINKSLQELDLRTKYKANVIAIKKKIPSVTDKGDTEIKQEINISPAGKDIIKEGDSLIVIGRNKDIERLQKIK
ncbi:MAG: TrkA family potassium uptake protein [Candidatus Omnitrophota bacterium]|nr:MAG: TrkA family potassium uptake protein [Candidatus Omnitrophota bacterium]